MSTQTIEIVDRGRGPQLSTTRITVLDVFYYLHRGDDFDFIHRAMPSLTREEFDVVLDYVNKHREELIEADGRAEAFIQRGIAEQKAKGLHWEFDESIPLEEQIACLKEKWRRQIAERNGGDNSH